MRHSAIAELQIPNPWMITRATGGYKAVEMAIKEMTPETVIEQVLASGLKRTGELVPHSRFKWKFTRRASGNEK